MTTDRPAITPRQIAAVTAGNALEFYDFLVYAFFAVQIAQAFFPGGSPAARLLAALATFGAGFATRPIGAIVLGRLADRAGRKPVMLLSFTLVGASSLAMALTPGHATIGIAAPLLVLTWRLVQGFALGGEVGASTAFLLEAAPPGRRGLYVSLQYTGQNVAILAAGLVGVALTAALGPAALAAWGWRVAVALGAVIVPFGIALRAGLPETLDAPMPDAAAAPGLAAHRRLALLAVAVLLAGTIATYVLNYMTTYAVTTLAMPTGVAFGATVVVGVSGTLLTPIGGLLADRYGRWAMMTGSWLALTLLVLPGFWLIAATRHAGTLYAVSGVLRTPLALSQAASLVLIAEALPARIRSGSLSILYALAISIFGGSTQFVVAWLIERTHDPLMPAWYLFGSALIGLAAMAAMRRLPSSGRAAQK